MVSSPDPLTITLIMHPDFAHQTTGLSRYALALAEELKQVPNLQLQIAPVKPPPMPQLLTMLAQRAGMGLEAFFTTYPLNWPSAPTGITHLTHRSQATLLLHPGHRRTIVTVHDIIHFLHRRNRQLNTYRHVIHALVDYLAVRALQRADAIIASSDYTRQTLITAVGIEPSRVTTIHLGVDNQRFYPAPVALGFFHRYGLSPDDIYLLHISTEEPRKNVASIVRAFALLCEKWPRLRLLKIGRPLYPAERAKLCTLINELGLNQRVIFVDNVPESDLPDFYRIARMLAFPSKEEGFGFPVLEAMACGTPVVCSNAASLPEIANDAALLIEPDDIVGMAAAIEYLITNDPMYQKLRRRGIDQAATFTWEHTARKTAAVYWRLCNEDRPL